MLWFAQDNATKSEPCAADSRDTRKAVLNVRRSNRILSDPLFVKRGLKKALRTTLGRHFGRTCVVLGL